MPGCVLVVDRSPDGRSHLAHVLASRGYDVECADGLPAARRAARTRAFLAAVVSIDPGDPEGGTLAAELAGDPLQGRCGVIAVASHAAPGMRRRLLGAGVIDVLGSPPDRRFLAARLRALGRPRSVADELALREETTRALGLADAPALASTVPGRIAVHCADPDAGARLAAALSGHLSDRLVTPSGGGDLGTDVSLLVVGDADDPDAVADLRARLRETRILALLPDGRGAAAAAALDLGADDVAGLGDHPAEIALRLRALVRQAQDRARCRVRLADGLASAHRDALTGLWNRRYAEPHLARLAETAIAAGRPLSVLMLDMDRFKSINDRYGHPAGDAVLREVAARLGRSVRVADLVARFGGEEFLVALPDTDPAQARAVAGRLCAAIGRAPFALPGGTSAPLTVSAGLAHLDPATSGSAGAAVRLVAAADRALLRSKTGGRARVTEDA